MVDRYWRLTAPVAAGVERALPDAHCEIVVQLAAPCARLDQPGGERVQPRCLFIGQMTRPVELRPLGAIDVFGVRFRPEAAPLRLVDEMLPLGEVWGSAADQWEERLRALVRTRDLVAETDDFLRRSLLPARRPDRRVEAAVRILRDGAPVALAAEAVELSRRQFERHFQSHVGLTPKLFGRISRFQRALALRREQADITWAQTALECGYFDQAHLAFDFREFAGQPPAAQEAAASSMERSLAARDAFLQDPDSGVW
jgi:AraC-like DNA-binding protein